MSSTLSVGNSLADLQQYAQSYLAQRTPAPQAALPNPYGTVTQSYQCESVLTDDGEYSYDLSKLDPGSIASNGENQTLLAVGQALKAATPVDPATGVSEINAGALASVAKALERSFIGLLSESAATWQTNTGGLSEADIDSAVTQAVRQFASGQNGGAFSLSLSTVKNSVIDNSGSTAGKPGLSPSYSGQNLQVISRLSTLSITLSADGKLSSSYQGTQLLVESGTATEVGVEGANATPNVPGWFGGGYYDVSDPILGVPQAAAGPGGGTGFTSRTLAFTQTSHTVFQSGTEQGAVGSEVIDVRQHGNALASSGYDEKGAWFSQAAALGVVTAVAQAFKSQADGSMTASLSIKNTLAVSLTDLTGRQRLLYTRPDGTRGRFSPGELRTVA